MQNIAVNRFAFLTKSCIYMKWISSTETHKKPRYSFSAAKDSLAAAKVWRVKVDLVRRSPKCEARLCFSYGGRRWR
jgi:hypothetical protein